MTSPHTQTLPIVGYTDRVSARPGERIEIKVSAKGEHYTATLLRILCADANPAGPGLKFESLDTIFAGTFPARLQSVTLGSYGTVPTGRVFDRPVSVVRFKVQPWLLKDSPSALLSLGDGIGWTLAATKDALTLTAAGESTPRLTLPVAMRRRAWYALALTLDRAAGRARLAIDGPQATGSAEGALPASPADAPLFIAAHAEGGTMGGHFNGRIETVSVHADRAEGEMVASWDFSRMIDTQAIIDVGPSGLHGHFVNLPTRAVRGSLWDGTEQCWRHAPTHYAAVHFHEDDIHDCAWETDFAITIPDDLPTGVYGVRLTGADAHEDIIPFFVPPPRGTRTADICYLASTFTYQAYANHARGNLDDAMKGRIAEWGTPPGPDSVRDYGFSTYNFHPDGSGTSYSSRLRPVLTFRPGFLTFADPRGSGLRHFPADSHLLEFMRRKDLAFDIVTDEELHREGVGLLADYPVVVTGSHPEYHTKETLDALAAYRDGGGNLIYLGGNGFYWRIAKSDALPGVLEIRRAETGIRAWATEPGENYNALDGAYGGLWRRNGRPPQALVGVGFSAQGLFDGSYYRRLPASHDPEVAWVFEGIENEIIGDYGLSGGGAAGFELDRADRELGTPEGAIILARSEAHSESFVLVPEEVLTHTRTVTGEPPKDLLRAEIVLMTLPGGGSVFSVGSITFCGSLPHNDFDNDVARMVENVLRRFRRGPLRETA
ncbi:N,N-dimethylformamidase beta subunit family domain-containing protein [Acuticoccus kandeliae]|uniref:N,N-dimethylformamidase beta subunit family domain-containing protein n=1 Tax=Acuticoccus kandeliae TaxID=2073160 RepID=UPI000D3E9712|nr:N,N-dimethylformamidase beta subunit family domain-containing protein [Acuticoccus kandeliae]